MKLVGEQLVQMPAEIHRPMKHKDWENLWSVSAVIVEEPVDQHPFIQKRENRGNREEEGTDQKNLSSSTKAASSINVQKLQEVAKNFPNQPQRPAFTKRPPRSDDNTNKQAVKSLDDNSVTCQPKNHIVFLKTHKTASSTILNILYRYGDSHNLTFALPLNMHSQLFYPAFFATHFVEGVRTRSVKEFHILCNHMRFSSPEVSLRARHSYRAL